MSVLSEIQYHNEAAAYASSRRMYDRADAFAHTAGLSIALGR